MSKRNENRPGYKQSPIGEIPLDWEYANLEESCAKIQDGTHFSPKTNHGPFRYLTSKNIRFGYLDLSNCCYISRHEHEAIYKRCPVVKGDLLLTKDGANTGNSTMNTLDEQFSLLSSVALIRGKPDTTINEYILHYVLSPRGQYYIKDAMAGQAITRITLDTIKKLGIPLPPLPEQKKIAEILSTWDEAIEKTQKFIQAKERRKKGLMQQLLTGKKRLPGFNGKWEKSKFKDIFQEVVRPAELEDDKKYSLVTVKRRRAGVEKRSDLYGRQILTKTQFFISENDFLISKRQIVHGACGIVPAVLNKSIVSNEYLVLRTNKEFDIRYMRFYSFNPQFQKDCYLSSIGVHIEKMLFKSDWWFKIKHYFPPLKEQQAIAALLSTADEEISLRKRKLEALKEQKKGLMQKLLTGEVRVKI